MWSWFEHTQDIRQAPLGAIPTAIHGIHPDIAVSAAVSMTDRIEDSPIAYIRSLVGLAGSRLRQRCSSFLGSSDSTGLCRTWSGIEPGRLAFGWPWGQTGGLVYRLILGEAARLVGVGAILGVGGSLAAENLMRGLFYAIGAWDVTMLAVLQARYWLWPHSWRALSLRAMPPLRT